MLIANLKPLKWALKIATDVVFPCWEGREGRCEATMMEGMDGGRCGVSML